MAGLTEKRVRESVSVKNQDVKPLELLIACQLFYPELVSTGQTLTELAEQLAAQGVDVEVLCGPPTVWGQGEKVAKHMVHQGIRIRRVWGTTFPKLSLAGRLVNQLSFTASAFLYLLLRRPKRPILVLTNPPFLAFACATLRVLGLGPAYLYLIFDVYPETAVRLGLLRERSWLTWTWERLNRFAYRHASAMIVIGRCMRDVVHRKLNQGGIPVNGNLRQIHVWCDDRAIRPVPRRINPLAVTLGVQDKFVVGYFGNMGRFHDVETILEAAESLRHERDIVFLLVGEGHKKQWAMRYARARGLDNCRFHGYVARELLSRLLSLADVGLVSLLNGQEGLSVPSKTFGLMAAGVPVLAVVPRGSEIARVVQEEGCGLWFEPGCSEGLAQGILELRRDRETARAMGANGRRAIESKYSLGRASRQYLDLLKAVGTESCAGHTIPAPFTAASHSYSGSLDA